MKTKHYTAQSNQLRLISWKKQKTKKKNSANYQMSQELIREKAITVGKVIHGARGDRNAPLCWGSSLRAMPKASVCQPLEYFEFPSGWPEVLPTTWQHRSSFSPERTMIVEDWQEREDSASEEDGFHWSRQLCLWIDCDSMTACCKIKSTVCTEDKGEDGDGGSCVNFCVYWQTLCLNEAQSAVEMEDEAAVSAAVCIGEKSLQWR